ncbi:MAG: hypothetical protein GY856_26925, partial [bacterium]|nr:hypothetical protein [bacterium]
MFGNVDFTPWLTAASGCIDAPAGNSPPFIAASPTPADGAVRAPATTGGLPADVALSWSGGDPDPWDEVVYDLYLGEIDALSVPLASDLADRAFSASGLQEGLTYYWKVIARDGNGEETEGPVWTFTTTGADPDLIASGFQAAPGAGVVDGDAVALTATIENAGAGPVVDPFTVEFLVGGVSIGTRTIDAVIPAGGSVSVSRTWTATYGDYSVEIRADAGAAVVETDEGNNTRTTPLSHVSEPAPPEFHGSEPSDGDINAFATHIVFTLLDRHGMVDAEAVKASISVVDSIGAAIAGQAAAVNDRFFFYPAASPFPDGQYTVSFTASDMDGNAAAHAFGFTVDGAPPDAPTITGGSVSGGLIRERPAANASRSASVTLTGTRDADVAIRIDGATEIPYGSGDWSIPLTLAQGDNALEILAVDRAGNTSAPVWVDIRVDSIAPVVDAVSPADNAFLAAPPSEVRIDFTEETS